MQQKRQSLNDRKKRKEVRRFGKEALKERPKSPPNNSFAWFVRENAAAVPAKENVFIHLSEKWRNMDDEQKLKYKEKLNESLQMFKRETAEWEEKHDRHLR